VLEAPELSEDPRFAEPRDRMDHLEDLEAALNAIFRIRGSADWLERFEAAGFPAGPVQSIQEMHTDPQALARRMVVDTEHTRAVLAEHGFGEAEIDALIADGAVIAAQC
jgi:crotonobetainyl-CoA:carnitine CoA-transferase CaiB-like acyl-CoA transferase